MYSYSWDSETGGLLLNSSPLKFSKEPRPVYYKELDMLGFNKYWSYSKNDSFPYMWAEANNYFYRGKLVAKTKGGSINTAPELIIIEEPEPNGMPLHFIDIPKMLEKNNDLLEKLVQHTIKNVYNTYIEYKNKIDMFYIAFSGGKDSIVTFDIVQRALPHNSFKVVFGDTGMEFPDTYRVIDEIELLCSQLGIEFMRAKSKLPTETTWRVFGPPAVTIRWCCSVHKTSPQIMLLQSLTKNNKFAGMAFTGIRGDESASRSEYDDINFGRKHRGQFSYHPIFEWNTAELFLYIFQRKLIFNEAYVKGNSRVGCLVCPMSSGKHEYMKAICYPNEVDKFIKIIKETSRKPSFSDAELNQFIEEGNWKTRKSGRELNLGQDKHIVNIDKKKTSIIVYKINNNWKEWAKTIGEFIKIRDDYYTIDFRDKVYEIRIDKYSKGEIFSFPNCSSSKNDIKFISLFRSVIVKSIYCVNCGVCVANCPVGCIDMNNGLKISDKCIHCYQCHDIYEHCLCYNSTRNKIGGEKQMKGMGRYFSFGIRKNWLDLYFLDKGGIDFWESDGRGIVVNKKKDAFLNFIRDAGIVKYNKIANGDKYSKNEPNEIAEILFNIGSDSIVTWAIMLCNLSYTIDFNWFVKNISIRQKYIPDQLKYMLEDVMEGDIKGLGKRNVVDAFKILLIKTPLGPDIGLGHCDYDEVVNTTGNEIIILKSFYRDKWENPNPIVILYSLYKFSETCGGYYQFTLTRLLDHTIDSDGISPTQIFSLDRSTMEKVLNGLSINYPEYIVTSFTLDLDNITLNSEKTSLDVLKLI